MKVLLGALVAVLLYSAPADAAMPRPPDLTVHRFQNPACIAEGIALPCAGASEVWVPRGAGRYAMAHETGHVWFEQVPTEEQRAWLTARLHGDDDPEELAAEAYATCDLGMSPRPRRARNGALIVRWPVAYDYHPTARRHRELCNAIAVIGLVAGYR